MATAPPEVPLRTSGTWSRGPRVVWAACAALALMVAMLAAGLRWGPVAEGLPDAGALVVNGLPVLRLVTLLAGSTLLGFLISAAALDTGSVRGVITPTARRDIAIGVGAALAMAVASVLYAVFTLADVLGLSLRELSAPGLVSTYLWDVEVSRAHLISAGLALVVALGVTLARTLTGVACWALVAALAVGLPSLTGHAAGLGSHSLALVAGFGHAVAAAVWGGGLVALATHAIARTDRMAERVRRFGVVAVIATTAVALTGFASAATRLDSPAQLLDTPYGRMVLTKVLALTIAVGLGLMIRRAWRGAAGGPGSADRHGPRPGRILAEVGVLGAALGIGVTLARTPLPRSTVDLGSRGEEIIGYAYPPAPTLGRVALGWHPDWVWLTVALLAIGLYTAGVIVLRRRGDAWPPGRLAGWALGWMVVIWATCSGVAWYAPVSFTVHMISHMFLAMVAPVLLVLGGPITLALRVIPAAPGGQRGPREWITLALHSPVTRFVTHPAYVLTVYTVGLYGLYFTGLYTTAMTSHLGHLAMQVHFLAAGYLFYWVIIGVDPGPRRLGYPQRLILLMASLVIHAFFAVPMMMAATPLVASWYALVSAPWMTDPVNDTHVAGAIAWGFGELPTMVVAIALGVQWSRSDEREARRGDRRADLDGDAELRAYNERLAALHHAGGRDGGSR